MPSSAFRARPEAASTRALSADELVRRCDPGDIPFDTTADARETVALLGQARAEEAVRLALEIDGDGYNVFALGPEHVCTRELLRELLARDAARRATPSDWCYVANLADPHRPRALELAPGVGARLRGDMARAVAELEVAMPAAFDSETYRDRKQQLVRDYNRRQERALDELKQRAKQRSVAVVSTGGALGLGVTNGDQMIEEAEFERLPERRRAELRVALEQTRDEANDMLRRFHDWTHDHLEAVAALDREIASAVAHRVIESVRASYGDVPEILAYLADVERDIVERANRLVAKPDGGLPEPLRRALVRDDDERFRRYEVDVLVDHTGDRGAPVVEEDNPTLANLVGRIEHVPELGALVTDFTLIRAGALHRANGGYLLLDVRELLQQPYAWGALKRALKRREIRIESLGEMFAVAPVASLEPEPIPLRVKVVLFGERLLYYLLAANDPELGELFKVMADFEDTVDRGRETHARYASLIATTIHGAHLPPFDRGAVARVVEHAARLAGDAQKLAVHSRAITDLLHEAAHHARSETRTIARADDVQAAIDARRRRTGLLRERTLEAIRRDVLLVATSGETIGQVNALSAIPLGDDVFAHPTRITARARVGKGEVIDIEREVALGGPIHSKGVLILGGLLGARYARRVPLSLSATIVFEQSYGGVEGDSASLAELCALLSAIAAVPIKQSLAVTGSVNQQGEVQPIGAVNEKIEGFFDVCRERGLDGTHGVVIPRGNTQHLMVRADVVEAVRAGRFHVHAVRDLDDALGLLTGIDAGARDERGRFPDGSFNARVEGRLDELAQDARRFAVRPIE